MSSTPKPRVQIRTWNYIWNKLLISKIQQTFTKDRLDKIWNVFPVPPSECKTFYILIVFILYVYMLHILCFALPLFQMSSHTAVHLFRSPLHRRGLSSWQFMVRTLRGRKGLVIVHAPAFITCDLRKNKTKKWLSIPSIMKTNRQVLSYHT